MPGLGIVQRALLLLVIAVFPFACGTSGAWIEARRTPLTIERIERAEGEGVQAVAAAVQNREMPHVLIYHTHTWEAYEMTEETQYEKTETWRTKDEQYNMIRVGEALAAELTARGFFVVHDKTAFEPPNLSSAYTRSLEMLDTRKAAGEEYDYIFDVHRDAYSGSYNGANGVMMEEQRVAYVMMLVGKGTGATGSGFDERPDWPQNLELAQRITDEMNALLPGVARDVKIKTGRFNQHVSDGALLIEVGNNRNTLDEALAACPVIAQAIERAHEARVR
ncbi:MAG: stage II sporulation protein P [Clostridia bacterium]|nr:stage II sporulation protein P [Clostridia bacterium]